MSARPHRTWPGSEAYRYLEVAGPADLAWEWLRRNPEYRRLAPSTWQRMASGVAMAEAASPECAARWGCLNVPDPDLRFTKAPVLWSADIDPSVLRVIASPSSAHDPSVFDLPRWGAAATVVVGSQGRESLLLRGAVGNLRMEVLSGSLLNGPVMLLHDFRWVHDVEPAIAALRCYLSLCRGGDFQTVRGPMKQTAKRLIKALRVHDALAEGASIRDVGVMLFGIDRVQAEWPGPGEGLKSQCRRLIVLSRFMASGGYRTLLS